MPPEDERFKALEEQMKVTNTALEKINNALETLVRLEEREKVTNKRLANIEDFIKEYLKSNIVFQTKKNTDDIKLCQSRAWKMFMVALTAAVGALFSIFSNGGGSHG